LKILLILVIIGIAFFVARNGFRVASRDNLPREALVAGRVFRDSSNFQKHEIHFNVEDINGFIVFLSSIEVLHADSMRVLQRNISMNSLIYLAEIRNSVFNQFLYKIRDFETFEVKKEQSVNITEISVDYSERIAVFEDRRQRLVKSLPNIENQSRINEAENQLMAIQTELDSLRRLVLEQEHYSNNSLLFLVINQAQSGMKNLFNFNSHFIVRFVAIFFMLIVLLILFIIVIDLILRIMSWLGIHTSTGKGGRYGSYKYGSYKYRNRRYGGSQRKVKRVYKDRENGG